MKLELDNQLQIVEVVQGLLARRDEEVQHNQPTAVDEIQILLEQFDDRAVYEVYEEEIEKEIDVKEPGGNK